MEKKTKSKSGLLKVQDLEHISVRQLAFKLKEADPTVHTHKSLKGEEGAKNRRPALAFFLGAGASKESGIMLASEMINIFKKDIFQRDCQELDKDDAREKWLGEQDWYKKEKPYGCLFERYRQDKLSRQRFIEEMISKAEPSFGYLILADLLNRNYINTIITTNFDDLVYVSATTFTGNRPVVYAYGIMASEMKMTAPHSRVLKLHGDYLYSSIVNTAEEMQEQSEAMQEPKRVQGEFIRNLNMARQVQHVFNEYGLVIIGYGGEDETVMELLNEISEDNGLYWCYRKADPPNQDVLRLVKNKRGKLVQIDGFDKLMKDIGDVTEFGVEELLASFDQRKEKTKLLITQFAPEYTKKALGEYAAELKEHAAEPMSKDDMSAADYFIIGFEADERKDFIKAEKAYRRAIELKPDYADAYHNLGVLLYENKRSSEAEKAYHKAMTLKPDYFDTYFNLGILLSDDGRIKEAEEVYREAIKLNPKYAGNYSNLVILLRTQNLVDEALKISLEAINQGLRGGVLFINLAALYKEKDDAEKTLYYAEEAEKTLALDDYYNRACLNAILERKNEAFRALKIALDHGKDREEVRDDPDWKWIKDDPRFEKLTGGK